MDACTAAQSMNSISGYPQDTWASDTSHASQVSTTTVPQVIHLHSRIGEGSFGKVYAGVSGGETVAVKVVSLSHAEINRELAIMQFLANSPHPNIIALKNYHHSVQDTGVICFIVMEQFPMSLAGLIKEWAVKGKPHPFHTKLISFQLTRGIAHIHGLGICHRDLKPHNVLVNPSTAHVKLCDFGSAKVLTAGMKSTLYISTRWYRSPELLLQNAVYTTAIDIWALGCVISEMVSVRPLFAGLDNTDQLFLILKARGTPTANDFEHLSPDLNPSVVAQLLQKPRSASRWRKLLGTPISPNFKCLLDSLLCWKPADRLSAQFALCEPYFDEIRNLTQEQQTMLGCPLFDFPHRPHP